MVLKCMQTYPLWDSTQGQQLEGCQLHIESGWGNWKRGKYWAKPQKPGSGTVPSLSPSPTQSPKAMKRLPYPGYYLGLHSTQITGYLLQGVKAPLPNIQKQTLGGWKIEKTKKYDPNERTEQIPRKRTKWNREPTYQMQSSKHWWSRCWKNSPSTATT